SIEQHAIQNHFEGSFVTAHNGNNYAISISNKTQADIFLNTKSQYLDAVTNNWKEDSDIGKAFTVPRFITSLLSLISGCLVTREFLQEASSKTRNNKMKLIFI
ncbi:MAG: hypothetical protein WBP01_10870, partial [Ferruginibacter sp.]